MHPNLKSLLAILTSLAVSLTIPAQVVVPPLINYQGVVIDSAGNSLPDGNTSISFSVWDSRQGGTILWGPKTYDNIAVIRGKFNASIGGLDSAGQNLSDIIAHQSIQPNAPAFIALAVTGSGGAASTTISPRQQFLSTGFAFVANTAHAAETLTGTLDASLVPTLDVSKIAGTIPPAQVPNLESLRGQLSANQLPSSTAYINQANPGGFYASGGSPGNHGYAFSGNGGDDDSGLYSRQDGNVSLFANGQEIVTVLGARVGINNQQPSVDLDVGGTANASIVNASIVNATTVNATTVSATIVNATTVTGYGTIPVGGIIMWSGQTSNIPDGWKLCNGADNTPDLRNKFVVGAGDAYSVKSTGGAKSVTLIVANLPPHNHGYNIVNYVTSPWKIDHQDSGDRDYMTIISQAAGTEVKNAPTDVTGKSQSFDIIPPYYALAYIMRTK